MTIGFLIFCLVLLCAIFAFASGFVAGGGLHARWRKEVTNDELESELGDVGSAISRLNSALASLRRQQAALKDERARRGLSVRAVSDHAVVRYLERHKGLDIEAIREELRAIADESVPTKDGEHHWHAASQTILVLGDDAQIITVLGPEQLDKWLNRKLVNGERIRFDEPASTPQKEGCTMVGPAGLEPATRPL